jgi:hypothetical protein
MQSFVHVLAPIGLERWLLVGRAGWSIQHLEKPDEKAVAANDGDRQQREEADDKKEEQPGFLATLGLAFFSQWHRAISSRTLQSD